MTIFNLYGQAGKEFALAQHRAVNQKYDGYLPYEFHLTLVAKTAEDFLAKLIRGGMDIGSREANIILNAAWCHDVLEDTHTTYNNLVEAIGEESADIVYAVTNEKGKTRAERANDKYYEGIRNTEYAVFVKLCDRIANVTYGKLFGGGLYSMYQREQEKFEEKLAGEQLDALRPVLVHLRSLLRG
jgi:(p)ppGpp synthase/HD superfamily hydrolase